MKDAAKPGGNKCGGAPVVAVAAGLTSASKTLRVLLLEAGGTNEDRDLRVDGQRWLTFQNKDLNWGYKTTPQEHCQDREVDYSRGKGLGGSSAINFGVYSVGASDDYEEWARTVGDDAFRWKEIQRRFKALETFHSNLPEGVDSKYAAPKPEHHGDSGKLQVGYAKEWEKDLPPMLDLFQDAGFPLNPDHNSGNPIGMSVLINSSHNGRRSTANDLLTPTPEGLTIVTSAPVQRLILEGTKAIGVEANGKRYLASKEVILSAGSLDTPKILMHSGIGPKVQMEKFGLPVVKDVPAVGQGLRDHMFCPLVYTRKEGDTARAPFYGDKAAMDAALEQWKKDGTGPWSKFACEMGIGWFKLDNLASCEEFKALPAEEQAFLAKETVPHYEVLTHFPIHWFIPGFPEDSLNYSCLLVWYLNAQARGEVTLQSADPDTPLRHEPRFLSDPFDRRVAIESLRAALRFAKHEGYAKDNTGTLTAPKGDSDEDLLAYWEQTLSSSWHMTGTTKMGRAGEADAVVDSDFRVVGFENLRVADMGVVPVLPSCHVQAVAYVTGATCAEKLVAEYGLA
ncbi:related to alcohol oxidase [Cephalotrichum gorgonifer]|uniref:Related to alcohol oxidase n=1 Tax=Cephalotrichum gorgonifer TaxID=2041049 RepID=A0AAE8N4X6_9PEZI|nr:related to alcohol oxidase [Cephalotrichum gorgonifer]